MELEIVDEGKINLIKKLLTLGANWSPLELEIPDEIRILGDIVVVPLEPHCGSKCQHCELEWKFSQPLHNHACKVCFNRLTPSDLE